MVWRRQSNFHMNNYPTVRVGSSFISIWLTGRTSLTKAASKAIVFRAPRIGGNWWAWSISARSSCSGLNMLTPLKLAHDLSSEWIAACSTAKPCTCVRPSSYARALVSLLCVYMCCPLVCFDVWSRVRAGNRTRPHKPFRHSAFPH